MASKEETEGSELAYGMVTETSRRVVGVELVSSYSIVMVYVPSLDLFTHAVNVKGRISVGWSAGAVTRHLSTPMLLFTGNRFVVSFNWMIFWEVKRDLSTLGCVRNWALRGPSTAVTERDS